MSKGIRISDAGLETWLIFQRGRELRDFSAFELLRDPGGRALLREYYQGFVELAAQQGLGLVLETPTWRASPDWGRRLGWSDEDLAAINAEAAAFVDAIRREAPSPETITVSGNIGPRGDGYVAGEAMSVEEAQSFHAFQIEVFAQSRVDRVAAFTMTNVAEATGIVLAAGECDIPCVIAFTLETDGRLPSGERLGEAIETMDASRLTRPDHYMINCAHPDHFASTIEPGAAWANRIHGVRANASRLSHEELDACDTLDDGDPRELATLTRNLAGRLPNLSLLGGCCGTDHRHVALMGEAFLASKETTT